MFAQDKRRQEYEAIRLEQAQEQPRGVAPAAESEQLAFRTGVLLALALSSASRSPLEILDQAERIVDYYYNRRITANGHEEDTGRDDHTVGNEPGDRVAEGPDGQVGGQEAGPPKEGGKGG